MNEVIHILSDPPHWIAHVIMDAAEAIPLFFIGRWWQKRHDRRAHGITDTVKEQ